MEMNRMEKPARNWASKREKKAQTMKKIEHLLDGKYVPTEAIIEVLEQLIRKLPIKKLRTSRCSKSQ